MIRKEIDKNRAKDLANKGRELFRKAFTCGGSCCAQGIFFQYPRHEGVNNDETEQAKQRLRAGLESATKNRTGMAAAIYKDKIGLEEAIEKEIFPCIRGVRIASNLGIKGVCFFQCPQWLLTNAHVLPSLKHIAMTTIDYEPLYDKTERSFHRPDDPYIPDIVLM